MHAAERERLILAAMAPSGFVSYRELEGALNKLLAYAALPMLPTLRVTAGPARAAAIAIWGPIVPCFALYDTLYGKRGAGLIALAMPPAATI